MDWDMDLENMKWKHEEEPTIICFREIFLYYNKGLINKQ